MSLISYQIKGVKAIKYIIGGLKAKNERIRDLALEAFFNQNNSQALENLVQAMKAPDDK